MEVYTEIQLLSLLIFNAFGNTLLKEVLGLLRLEIKFFDVTLLVFILLVLDPKTEKHALIILISLQLLINLFVHGGLLLSIRRIINAVDDFGEADEVLLAMGPAL